MNDPMATFNIQDLVEHFVKAAERQVIDDHPEQNFDSRDDVWLEGDWAEYVMRYASEFVTDLVEQLGQLFTPEGSAAAARQAWFGDDFNYTRPEGDHPGHWNAAFLYNASEAVPSLQRLVAYEFVRRGYLLPHEAGKNHADFREGGLLA